MKINDWLQSATKQLAQNGIQSARLDALILLEDQLQLDRSHLLAFPEAEIAANNYDQLAITLARRLHHEPLAYIRGFCEFYGRNFSVNKHVLVPRPESETMITLLKKYASQTSHIADIGTGSGALAITASLETGALVSAVDIDEACLTVAKSNAVQHTASVTWLYGSLLEPFLSAKTKDIPDTLLANLPYVPIAHPINKAAQHEPALALFAGDDGLELYRSMFEQTQRLAQKPSLVFTEALPSQHSKLQAVARTKQYELVERADYIQVFTYSTGL